MELPSTQINFSNNKKHRVIPTSNPYKLNSPVKSFEKSSKSLARLTTNLQELRELKIAKFLHNVLQEQCIA